MCATISFQPKTVMESFRYNFSLHTFSHLRKFFPDPFDKLIVKRRIVEAFQIYYSNF